jgi:hypothetical protein
LTEEGGVVELEIIDGGHLDLVEPLDALAVLPKPVLNFVVFRNKVGADAVLLAFEPVSLIATSISPGVNAEAMFFVILVLALVHSSVVPQVDAHALHVVFEPLALVPSAVEPAVNSYAGDLVLLPVSHVLRAVVPLVAANAMLATECVVPLVARFVCPSLNTLTMLQIVLPHALVLRAINVLVDTSPVGLIVRPEPVVDVPVHMSEGTLPVRAVLSPFTFVLCSIRPDLHTFAVPEAAFPLSSVNRASLEGVWWSVLPWLVRIIQSLRHSLASFFLREILAAAELFGFQHRNQASTRVASPPSLEFDDVSHVLLKVLVIITCLLHKVFLTLLVRFGTTELFCLMFLPLMCE